MKISNSQSESQLDSYHAPLINMLGANRCWQMKNFESMVCTLHVVNYASCQLAIPTDKYIKCDYISF